MKIFTHKIILGESMGSKLSKTVLGMSVGGLERILRHSPCWSEIVKNHKKSWFFAFFAKPLDHVLHHKFGSKRFKNIWGSVLESLWSVLSISKFFFLKNLALFATRTVSSNFITKTRHFSVIPFWLQKGIKNVKNCINKIISWKYAFWAFKIRF